MRKRFSALIIVIMFLIGCVGFKPDVAVNMATDVAFSVALTKHPELKPVIIVALTGLKTFLAGNVTYDDLIVEISKRLGGEYAYIGVIVTGYVETDKPISETYLTLFDAYKTDLIKKIDRLLLIANMQQDARLKDQENRNLSDFNDQCAAIDIDAIVDDAARNADVILGLNHE